MELSQQQSQILETGYWAGRHQALGMISGKCTAAQAHALKEMRDNRIHDAVGLSWEDFCAQCLHICRATADNIIRRYNELGADYFRLSEICRLSPETFQSVAPRIQGDFVELDGERIEISGENAQKIRAGIRRLREDLDTALDKQPKVLADLFHRIDRLTKDIYHYYKLRDEPGIHGSLATVARYAVTEFASLGEQIAPRIPGPPVNSPQPARADR
jgi:hypothetical protein